MPAKKLRMITASLLRRPRPPFRLILLRLNPLRRLPHQLRLP
jgi:hypothetical protein